MIDSTSPFVLLDDARRGGGPARLFPQARRIAIPRTAAEVSAAPELFYRRERERLTARRMKGTAARRLGEDREERAENLMAPIPAASAGGPMPANPSTSRSGRW